MLLRPHKVSSQCGRRAVKALWKGLFVGFRWTFGSTLLEMGVLEAEADAVVGVVRLSLPA